MFGIGLLELLTILVLATLVMGPEGMVKFAGQLGQWLAKFRRETEGVTKEFKEAFNLELLNPKEFDRCARAGSIPRTRLGGRPTDAQWNARHSAVDCVHRRLPRLRQIVRPPKLQTPWKLPQLARCLTVCPPSLRCRVRTQSYRSSRGCRFLTGR